MLSLEDVSLIFFFFFFLKIRNLQTIDVRRCAAYEIVPITWSINSLVIWRDKNERKRIFSLFLCLLNRVSWVRRDQCQRRRLATAILHRNPKIPKFNLFVQSLRRLSEVSTFTLSLKRIRSICSLTAAADDKIKAKRVSCRLGENLIFHFVFTSWFSCLMKWRSKIGIVLLFNWFYRINFTMNCIFFLPWALFQRKRHATINEKQ